MTYRVKNGEKEYTIEDASTAEEAIDEAVLIEFVRGNIREQDCETFRAGLIATKVKYRGATYRPPSVVT